MTDEDAAALATAMIYAGELEVTIVASTRAFAQSMLEAARAWTELARWWRPARRRIHPNARRRRKRARRGR